MGGISASLAFSSHLIFSDIFLFACEKYFDIFAWSIRVGIRVNCEYRGGIYIMTGITLGKISKNHVTRIFDATELKNVKFKWKKQEKNKHTRLEKYNLNVTFTVDVDKIKYKDKLNTKY